jgi:Tol biopolymer transport system component
MLVVTVLGVPPAAATPPAAVTALLSAAPDGAPGNGDSFDPALSADGSTVAFASLATNLTARDAAGVVNVFVRDRRCGRTARVSNAPDGMAGDGDSTSPAVSADGAVVAFDSFAANLVAGDTNGVPDVFVFDRASGRTTRVSVDSGGGQGNGGSSDPSISADGRFVAFASDATALVPGDHNRAGDVFVRDRRTVLASAGPDGRVTDRGSSTPVLSASGRGVAFVTDAALVADDTNGTEDVYVFDIPAGTVRRVSVASDGRQGDRPSTGPSISGDAGTLVFESLATNLVPADSNGAEDVFWRD